MLDQVNLVQHQGIPLAYTHITSILKSSKSSKNYELPSANALGMD